MAKFVEVFTQKYNVFRFYLFVRERSWYNFLPISSREDIEKLGVETVIPIGAYI